MKKIVIGLLTLGSISTFAKTGNICTVALFEKSSDYYGNPTPGKALGVTSLVNTDGTSGEFGKLHNVSKTRAIIANAVIDMAGAFRMTIQEVDQDKDGFVTFKNSKNLTEEKYYYSPYPELPAENKPVIINLEKYVATLSCILYTKN